MTIDENRMPSPAGFRILCAVPKADETFEGTNLIKPDAHKAVEQHATVVLFVLKLGPEAYQDPEKFPSGAYCKEGDFVLVRAYTGTRFKIDGQEFRIIHDDHVEGVVADPRGLTRI